MRITAKDVERLAKGLENSAEILARAGYRAINKVARKYDNRSRAMMVAEVTLTKQYLKDRMDLKLATMASQVAVISARKRPTTLARFQAKQLTRAAKRAKGDERRGIPKGRKQAGVSVKVKRSGSRKQMRGAFLIPLRAGKAEGANGFGVFTRSGDVIQHRYGPSVDQLFRGLVPKLEPEIAEELRDTLAKQTVYEFRKSIARV